MLTQAYKAERKKVFIPVLYASRSLKGMERKYSISDLKSTCCSLGSEDIQVVRYGTLFKVVSDHNVLKAHIIKLLMKFF